MLIPSLVLSRGRMTMGGHRKAGSGEPQLWGTASVTGTDAQGLDSKRGEKGFCTVVISRFCLTLLPLSGLHLLAPQLSIPDAPGNGNY